MNGPILEEDTVQDVLSRYPGTRAVFARYGLDVCCGGRHTIALAARARGVALDPLLAELNAVRPPA